MYFILNAIKETDMEKQRFQGGAYLILPTCSTLRQVEGQRDYFLIFQ
jgi:hypothetical protein